jgi:stringent starvation protein B
VNREQQPDRLRAILAELLRRRIAESLGEVEQALAAWRADEVSVFEAHAEILRHIGRSELAAEQISRPDVAVPGLLREAFDRGVIGEPEFVELVGKPPAAVEPLAQAELGAALPAKREVVEDLLAAGPILVHLDARAEGVAVPECFASEARLVLRFGYDLSPPIVDLEIADGEMAGTLTFSGVPFRCVLPWTSVYAVVAEADQKGMVWPDDVPSTVLDELSAGAPAAAVDPGPRGARAPLPSRDEVKRGAHLKLVK